MTTPEVIEHKLDNLLTQVLLCKDQVADLRVEIAAMKVRIQTWATFGAAAISGLVAWLVTALS